MEGHGCPAVHPLGGETWAARRSVHKDVRAGGTAAWDEWVHCFKDAHAEAEAAFTPAVEQAARLGAWDCGGTALAVGATTWEACTLRLEAAAHRLPFPLRTCGFAVLQPTAAARGRREFVVVQVAVRGAYTSVERVRALAGGRVEWVMGTASEAGGAVPRWVQRRAVPGRIASDVDLFLGWIARERGRGGLEL